jgi:arginyl-tRNA synthetase
MYAVCKALGKEPGKDFEIIIFQLVRFVKDGKEAPMRKRDGNIYELRDLIAELGETVAPKGSKEEQQRTGSDVARFFYLMRSHDTTMDFDIDLATKQSDENPVFYVQYAHARICGVLRKAEESGIGYSVLGIGTDESDPNTQNPKPNTQLLVHPRELSLIKRILDLPEEVQRSAKDYGVHRIATYAIELARTFHHFYDACRVIQPDQPELTQARFALAKAAQIALKSALDLLGVSAPEKMERAVEADQSA